MNDEIRNLPNGDFEVIRNGSSKWTNFCDGTPDHKDLVLVDVGAGVAIPAIFYYNNSFKGFWKFTSDYHTSKKTVYKEVPLKPEFEIKGVIKWMLMPKV